MRHLGFASFVANRLQKHNHKRSFGDFVSNASTIGIGLGCFVLILLLSIMNGFEDALETQLLAKLPHAELIDATQSGIAVSHTWLEETAMDSRVKNIYLKNQTSGLLQKTTQFKAVQIMGVSPEYSHNKLGLSISFDKLTNANSIALGRGILDSLDLSIGDSVQLLLPNVSKDLGFRAPKVVNLRVVDSINLSGELSDFIAIMDRSQVANILGIGNNITHIEFALFNPYESYQFIREVGFKFNQQAYMSDWTRTHGHLHQDIKLVRVVVYIVLALVICIASFNILSSLVMMVKEKQKEIAILKTMGARTNQIRLLFIIQGLSKALQGALVGTILGVVAALNISDVFVFFQRQLDLQVLSDGIYFVDALPSKLLWTDALITFSLAIVLAFFATLYPANRAASIKPAAELS